MIMRAARKAAAKDGKRAKALLQAEIAKQVQLARERLLRHASRLGRETEDR
jgi:hypothetical protein